MSEHSTFRIGNRRISRRMVLRGGGAVIVALASGALVACGGGDAGGAEIEMTNEMVFKPASITIKPGEKVTWKNVDSMVHTVTADPGLPRDPSVIELPAGVEPFHSGNITNGQSWSMTFSTPGRYRYVCLPHELAGMTGEVIVEE
jgi:plastocyanin